MIGLQEHGWSSAEGEHMSYFTWRAISQTGSRTWQGGALPVGQISSLVVHADFSGGLTLDPARRKTLSRGSHTQWIISN